MCDFNLLTRKLVSVANKKVEYSTACDLAQDAILNGLTSYKEDRGCTLETFIFGCLYKRIADYFRSSVIRQAYSLDGLKDNEEGNNREVAGKTGNNWDTIVFHLQECLEESIISQDEYNVLILKGMGEQGQDIANNLGLSAGRVSQIYSEALEKVGV